MDLRARQAVTVDRDGLAHKLGQTGVQLADIRGKGRVFDIKLSQSLQHRDSRFVEVAQVLIPAGDDRLHDRAIVPAVHLRHEVAIDLLALCHDGGFLLG